MLANASIDFWEKVMERWRALWLLEASLSRILSHVRFSILILAFPLLSQALCRIARSSPDLPTVRGCEPRQYLTDKLMSLKEFYIHSVC